MSDTHWGTDAMNHNLGEWWLTGVGEHTYCDGDIIDTNHEGVVIEHCMLLLLDELESSDDPLCEAAAQVLRRCCDGDCVSLREAVHTAAEEWLDQGLVTPDEYDDVFAAIQQRIDIDDDIFDAAIGSSDCVDAREVGLKLGWVRVRHNDFQVRKLTKEVCDTISNFAYEQEHNDWNLEVLDFHGRRIYVTELTLVDLESFRSLVKAIRRAGV